ncbi:replication protein [Gracilibacillus sp. S3-1-1]|uniref:Replication protein n=1 Tax=Gracilibacillus pellucidus TaxID=3095368 RepID=A0ACC6M886_9BACI|nr:replication protein [Gracilibacillus sp. S3-1-1]MDX8047135.1 replication protein [Gracilibacillus sp. S3-1-1]
MANPQLENGYTRIANELWNEILRRNFTKRQINLILFIWRLSYGTGQKACKIAKFTSFEQVGMYKQDVKKELVFLRECAVLEWEEESMVFSINKHYQNWQVTPNKKWDNEAFNQLIYENIKRKKATNTKEESNQQGQARTVINLKVRKILTSSKQSVSKTRTLKLVKYVPQQGGKSVTIKRAASLKKVVKKLVLKDIKIVSSYSRDHRFGELIQFYRANLQRAVTESPFNYELLTQWYSEVGYDLLYAAMKVSAKAEAKGVRFLEGVLSNWKEAGVQTLDDATQYEKQVKANKKSSYSKKKQKNNKADIVPEWYQKQQTENKQEVKQESEADRKRKAEEVDRMLEEYLKERQC